MKSTLIVELNSPYVVLFFVSLKQIVTAHFYRVGSENTSEHSRSSRRKKRKLSVLIPPKNIQYIPSTIRDN